MTYEPNHEYHADYDHVSNSMLGDYEHSPEMFRRMYIEKSEPRGESTRAQALGSLVHCVLLEPDRLNQDFYTVDASTRNTKVYHEAKKACPPEKQLVLLEEVETAARMAEAVEKFPLAMPLLERMTVRERVYRWVDPATGVPCKCRLDMREPYVDVPTDAADIKTANDIRAPWWEIDGARYYGYDRQAAFYRFGCRECDEPIRDFYFVVVESKPPFAVRVCKVGQVWAETGQRKAECLLMDLAVSRATNRWLAPYQDRIVTLGEGE